MPASAEGELAQGDAGRGTGRAWLLARILPAVGTLLWLAALFLPWEHVVLFASGTPGDHISGDVPITTVLVSRDTKSLAGQLLFLNGHAHLAQLYAGALWQAALPLLGVVLLLVFLAWRAPLSRWLSLAALALWTAFGTALAVSFPRAIAPITHQREASSFPLPGPLAFWQRLTAIGDVYVGAGDGLAWGYWIFVLGLALAWAGLMLAALAMWRRRTAPVAEEGGPLVESETTRARRLRSAGALVGTACAVIWIAALLALPLGHVRCDTGPQARNLSTLAACELDSNIYALGAEAAASIVIATQVGPSLSANEEMRLLYLRTFVLLALVLVTAPFALGALWRRTLSRWGAVGVGLWLALMLGATWSVIASIALFISPPTSSTGAFRVTTPSDPAPGLFIVLLAALGVVVGIALWSWPRLRRPWPALA